MYMSSEQDFKIKYLSYKMKYLKLKQLDNEANGGSGFPNVVKTIAKKVAMKAKNEAPRIAKETAQQAAKEAAEKASQIAQNKISSSPPRTPPPSPTNIKYDSNNINAVREQLDHANRKIAEYQVLLNSRE